MHFVVLFGDDLMAEKRFTIKPQDDYFGITDNNTADKMNVINGIRTEIETEWLCDLLNELAEKNKQCKEYNAKLYSNSMKSEKQLLKQIKELEEENKQLQERNNRQAKQLDDLYRLIEEKDWRALSDILDDFKKAEEQLQKEWSEYND